MATHIYEPPAAAVAVAAPAPPTVQANVTLVLVAGMIVCVTIFFVTYFIAYRTIFGTRGEWNQNFSIHRAALRRNTIQEEYRSEGGGGGGEGGAGAGSGASGSAGPGLEASLLRSFPITHYSSAMASTCSAAAAAAAHVVQMKECAVCLCEFEEGEEMKVLPVCGHAFHKTCIDRWLFSHTTCPICRLSLLRKHAGDKQVALVEQPSASALPPPHGLHVAVDIACARLN